MTVGLNHNNVAQTTVAIVASN